MKRLCVFCGSGLGMNPEFVQAAEQLGQLLAVSGIGLVYGGGRVGLMGKIASEALRYHGDVIGVIPRSLYDKEVAFTELPDLRIVESMHERKALMEKLSDGFIALPGGLGTIEEIFEMITWAQLGIHCKPCGFLNVGHFFDDLIGFLDHATDQAFIDGDHRHMIMIDDEPEGLLKKIKSYVPPITDKTKWALKLINN